REYHLITRVDRLEIVAVDLVAPFMERGQTGKAMVVSIDKATAVRMYDKVQTYWLRYLDKLRSRLSSAATEEERARLTRKIAEMQAIDMAVVVSQAQNEVADFQKKGLDIVPHRRRMVTEDLEKKFKDASDPLRIVFVCAMWMTGFDVPSLSTIYLDKPIRNHTLMQTIARANRVFRDKLNGLIVDYVGIFRDLQKALSIYGTGPRAGDETPIQDKSELIAALQAAIAETTTFCAAHAIDPQAIIAAQGFDRVRLLEDAVDALVVNDDTRKKYIDLAAAVARLYRAILPDTTASTYTPIVTLYAVIAAKIKSLLDPADISDVIADIDRLLDESIATDGYVIKGVAERGELYAVNRRVDLSQIDFDALRAHFERARKHTEVQKLRGAIGAKIARMVRLNKTRANYLEKLQRLIDEYNVGSLNVEIFFDKLVALAQEINAEDQRAIAEQLTEEELAVFDLLTRPDLHLTDKDTAQVKKVARDLLDTLKHEMLVLDWRKRQQTRAQVQLTVQKMLDAGLPPTYTSDLYQQKCEEIYQHIYESYYGPGQSKYAQAS
ncbi:MAG: type I restriction enzyme endonuclease domain-containing protein, partial [Ktedonobacterales bacterium]